ncbi:MAG: hypothetical protein EHM64_08720 [Ignavibacteriae bacterium]|nr:MAG: hypothetical protein EHM64_08720 [Ignavibacteriota bacterium]
MRSTLAWFICLFALVLTGCSTLVLQPADFSWPVELVLKPDGQGTVHDSRYQVSFNVKALLFEERQDSIEVTKYPIHVLCDRAGFYFITGKGFKHVYVFCQADGALKLEKKIFITEQGLEAPALNQNKPYIRLINEKKENEAPLILSNDGIIEGGKQ